MAFKNKYKPRKYIKNGHIVCPFDGYELLHEKPKKRRSILHDLEVLYGRERVIHHVEPDRETEVRRGRGTTSETRRLIELMRINR